MNRPHHVPSHCQCSHDDPGRCSFCEWEHEEAEREAHDEAFAAIPTEEREPPTLASPETDEAAFEAWWETEREQYWFVTDSDTEGEEPVRETAQRSYLAGCPIPDEMAAEVARLRAALEPFAKAAGIKLCGEWRDDEHFSQTDVGFYLTFGDLRRAAQALSSEGSGE